MTLSWGTGTLIICATLIAALAAYLFIAEPFKITDPSDPRFNPDKFKFSDYKSRDDLIHVYRTTFPVGTSKAFVDRVLIKSGKATCGQNKTYPNLWHCRQPKTLKHWDIAPHLLLIYDDNLNLLNINPNGMGEIYPDSVTFEELKNYEANKGD